MVSNRALPEPPLTGIEGSASMPVPASPGPIALAPDRIHPEHLMQLAVILGIVIAVIGVAFAMQNIIPVTVVFLLWRFEGSLAVIVIASIALGALAIALVSLPAALRSRWTISRQGRELAALKETSANLRSRVAELERRSGGPDERADSNRHPGAAR